jgi:hypothetical protein
MIKADGITDDLAALNEWVKAGGITPLPSGIIRITDTWVIGDIFYTPEMLFDKDMKGMDLNKYHYAQYTKAIDIIGSKTTIWLDNADTNKAVISYNAQGLKEGFAAKISGLKLIGKGYGITAAFVKNLTIDNVIFKGFKNGLVLNNCYFLNANNLRFENCDRAEYDIRCHSSKFEGVDIAFCKKGFEIHSNRITVSRYYASHCLTALHDAGGYNRFENIYLETTKESDGQLIIGNETGSKVELSIYSGVTISAPYIKAIVFMPTAGANTFESCGFQSTLFEVKQGSNPICYVKNCAGKLPAEIVR